MLINGSDQGIGVYCLALVLGVLARAFLIRTLRLPYTVVVLLMGTLIGFISSVKMKYNQEHGLEDDLFIKSVHVWTSITPEEILFIILPILLFEGAFNANFQLFLTQLTPVLALAFGLVIFNSFIVGLCLQYCFPYGWDFNLSMMVAAMLSSTDPVAVLAVLKELGVHESLSILVEGEPLLNDASSVIIFSLFADKALGHTSGASVSDTVATTFKLVLGGPAIGVGIGMLATLLLGLIQNDHLSECTITWVVGFAAFVLSESTGAHASGVLAMVCAGLYMSFYSRSRVSSSVSHSLHSFWEVIGYMTNTLIFFVSGLIMAEKVVGSNLEPKDWGYLFLLYFIVTVARLVGVAILYPILSHGAYGINWKQAVVLGWGGLRGAFGLVLAMALYQQESLSKPVRDRIMFFMAGIVFLTIVINGITISPLLHMLKLDVASASERAVFARTSLQIEQRLESFVDELKVDPFLGDADWKMVWRYLPVHTAEVYWHRLDRDCVHLEKHEVAVMYRHIREQGVIVAHPQDPESKKDSWWTTYLPFLKDRSEDPLPYRIQVLWKQYASEFNDLRDSTCTEDLHAIRLRVYDSVVNRLMTEDKNYDRHNSLPRMGPVESDTFSNCPLGHLGSEKSLFNIRYANSVVDKTSYLVLPTPDPEEKSSMREARERVLTVLKQIYWAKFKAGVLTSDGLVAVEKVLHFQKSRVDKPLDEWNTLERELVRPMRQLQGAERYRRAPIIGYIIERGLFNQLNLMFQLAINFIQAHEEVDIRMLFGSGNTVATTIKVEIEREVANAERSIKLFLPAFPLYFNSVKTEMASRILLHHYHSLLEEFSTIGALDAREFEKCSQSADDALVALYSHNYREKTTSRAFVLKRVGFLRFMDPDHVQALFCDQNHLCYDAYFGANDPISIKDKWFVVVRGTVSGGDKRLSTGSTFGIIEHLLQRDAMTTTEYQAATFTHLLCFDAVKVLEEARKNRTLEQSLYWYCGVTELVKHSKHHNMTIGEAGLLLASSRMLLVPEPLPPSYTGPLKIGMRLGSSTVTTPDQGPKSEWFVIEDAAHVFLLKGSIQHGSQGFPLQGTIQAPRYIPDARGRFALAPGGICFLMPTTYIKAGRTFSHHPALHSSVIDIIRESSHEDGSYCNSYVEDRKDETRMTGIVQSQR